MHILKKIYEPSDIITGVLQHITDDEIIEINTLLESKTYNYYHNISDDKFFNIYPKDSKITLKILSIVLKQRNWNVVYNNTPTNGEWIKIEIPSI
jgi:hypothetical protein